jgi:hypothetical protein
MSLSCAYVNRKVINNAKGQHGLEVSNAIFLCRAVVGNLTTITATVDV